MANDNKRTDARLARQQVLSRSPDAWVDLDKLQYGGDYSLAHVIENQVLTAPPSTYPKLEKDLLDVIDDGEVTDAAKDFVCRQLRIVGSVKCAAVLAPLLASPKLSHAARLALETIQGEAVDKVLRDALERTGGKIREGLLGTINFRQKQRGKIL
jgi:hypothetical protein